MEEKCFRISIQKQNKFSCSVCQVTMNSQKQYENHMLSPRHINTKNSLEKVGGVGMANMALQQNMTISEAIGPKRPKYHDPYA